LVGRFEIVALGGWARGREKASLCESTGVMRMHVVGARTYFVVKYLDRNLRKMGGREEGRREGDWAGVAPDFRPEFPGRRGWRRWVAKMRMMP
jgi:hypothetical protein